MIPKSATASTLASASRRGGDVALLDVSPVLVTKATLCAPGSGRVGVDRGDVRGPKLVEQGLLAGTFTAADLQDPAASRRRERPDETEMRLREERCEGPQTTFG